jgi:hypothetical protein
MHIFRQRALMNLCIGGFALFFLLCAHTAQAREHPCADPFDCLVPTPTVILPSIERTFVSSRAVVITGLSWNQTKVDVYIDGVYNGRAELRTDPSEVGNFVYRPFVPLTSGKHSVYTVARNLSELERSPESQEISFTVTAAKAAPAFVQLPEGTEPKVSSVATSTEPRATSTQSANSILNWFFQKQGESEASTTSSTVSFLNSTFARASMIFIFVIVFGFVIFYLFRPKYEEALLYDEERKDGGPPEDDSA